MRNRTQTQCSCTVARNKQDVKSNDNFILLQLETYKVKCETFKMVVMTL